MSRVSKLNALLAGAAMAAFSVVPVALAVEITPSTGVTDTAVFLGTKNGTPGVHLQTYNINLAYTPPLLSNAQLAFASAGYLGSVDQNFAQTTGAVTQAMTWGTTNGNLNPVHAAALNAALGYYPLDGLGNSTPANGGSYFAGGSTVSLGGNGSWDGSIRYLGVNSDANAIFRTDTVYLYFSHPIAGFSALLNYNPNSGSAPTISALAQDTSVLGSDSAISFSTPGFATGVNQGRVFGFLNATPNISFIALSNASAVLGNIAITYGASVAVPEPMTLAILGTGLLGLGLVKRRRPRS